MLQSSRCEKFADPREVLESAFLARDVSIESFLFGSHLTNRLIASFVVPSLFDAVEKGDEKSRGVKKAAGLMEYEFTG